MAHTGGEVQPASVPDGESLVGQLVGSTYRVEHLLGGSGRAAVWTGVNERTGRRVALKMIRRQPSSLPAPGAFLDSELLAASGITHPNVVAVYDVIEHDGMTCIVMEFLEGESLDRFIARRRRLKVAEVMGLLLPAMRGVSTAHAMGIIHRDLRPGNIFVCLGPDDRVVATKVLGLGVSKMLEREREREADRMVSVPGTPAHMAPERLDRSMSVDQRTDVYSFGALFYEALTGKPPFPGEPDLELLRRVLTEPPAPLASLRPDLPAGLVRIIEKAMAKQPAERYADLDAMVAALEDEIVRPEPSPASAMPAEPREEPSDSAVPTVVAEQPSSPSGRTGETRVGVPPMPRAHAETLIQTSGAFGPPALPTWAMQGAMRTDDGPRRTPWVWRGIVIAGAVLVLGYVLQTYRELIRQRDAAEAARAASSAASATSPARPTPTAVAAPASPAATPARPAATPAATAPREAPLGLRATAPPPAPAPSVASATVPTDQPPTVSKEPRKRRRRVRTQTAAEEPTAKVPPSTPTLAPTPTAAQPVPVVRPPAPTLAPAPASPQPAPVVRPPAPMVIPAPAPAQPAPVVRPPAPTVAPAPAADKPSPEASSPPRTPAPRAGNLTPDEF